MSEAAYASPLTVSDGRPDRITLLENEVTALKQEIDWIKQKLSDLLN
jgi:hypothetical protein